MAPIDDFHFMSDDGLRLYCAIYRVAGDPLTTVLCIPGLTRNSRDFAALATHLQALGYPVLAPDLRGRGRSDYDPEWRHYHPGTYIGDLWKLLATLQVPRVAIIGTSLGALLAMLMAAQHPERIAGIVLNDAGPEIDGAGLARIARYVGAQPAAESWEQAAAQAEAIYGDALPGLDKARWLAYTRQSYKEDAAGRPVPDMDPHIGTALRADSGASAPDLWPLYAQLKTMPTLALRGASSDILSAATFARMAREKPDLKQVTVADRGHAPLLDEPECVAAIEQFLRGLH